MSKPEYTCPHCGGSHFTLTVTQLVDVEFSVDDHGEQDHRVTDGPRGDMEWGGETHAICLDCRHCDTLANLKTEGQNA